MVLPNKKAARWGGLEVMAFDDGLDQPAENAASIWAVVVIVPASI